MKNVSDHAHPMHKGPHHSKYMHSDNQMHNDNACGGSHELGDESHLSSLMGSPKGRDLEGHNGKMSKGK